MRKSTHLLRVAALALGVWSCAPPDAGAPEPVGDIAPFQLSDQDGHPFGLEQMLGKVWVADFFFTSCPSICPLLTESMQELAREFANEPELRFLSISVDPETDTPEVLRAHAESLRLPQTHWRLLSGPRADVHALCEQSFRLAFGEEMSADGDILHSTRLVIVDARGRVRSYHDALDPAARTGLRKALRAVLAEQR